jgi:hypothetical protein
MGGSSSKCVTIVTQDSNPVSVFTNYEINKINSIQKNSLKPVYYLICSKREFTECKQRKRENLLKSMNMESGVLQSQLLMNNDGTYEQDDIDNFTKSVKTDLNCILNNHGYTIKLIINSRCDILLSIINKFLIDRYILPSVIEIYIVIKNDNCFNIFYELNELDKNAHRFKFKLIIKNFTTNHSKNINSLKCADNEKLSKCMTSNNFSKEIFKFAYNNNQIAIELIQHAIESNICVLYNLVEVVNETINIFKTLNILHNINDIALNIDNYIDNIITDDCIDSYKYKLNILLCNKLNVDICKIISVVETELKVPKYMNICNTNIEILYSILEYYTHISNVLHNNLLYFNIESLSTVLMYESNTTISEINAFSIESNYSIEIVDEKSCANINNFKVNHYISTNTLETLKTMENIILKIINTCKN